VVLLKVGVQGALVILPESSGLVPAWCAAPDASGQSKLTTLAQELGMLVLPEAFMPEDFQAARVADLSAALQRAGIAADAAQVPLVLTADGKTSTMPLVWPISNPDAVFAEPAPGPEAEAPAITVGTAPPPAKKPAAAAPSPASAPPPPRPAAPQRHAGRGEQLPVYSRSLLRIEVPVAVTLAAKKQAVGQIIELAPGAIIQFNKSCEEMLDLEVGGRSVGKGEAVKVGEKFGIRLTSLTLPEERFKPVRPR
jgi:flagellar motor switch/type III secretory pathway protein FliN